MSVHAPTVFVVDDDVSVRLSLTRLFKLENLNVEAFSNADAFLSLKSHSRPACVVTDMRMPGKSGLDLQNECEQKAIQIPMVFITGHGDIPMTVQAMKKGAVDFLPKPFDPDTLLRVVKQAIQKDHGDLQKQHKQTRIKRRWETLSERERAVLAGVISGLLNKQIASRMGIMEKTVKFHRANVMRKMKAASVAHLVRLAETAGVKAS